MSSFLGVKIPKTCEKMHFSTIYCKYFRYMLKYNKKAESYFDMVKINDISKNIIGNIVDVANIQKNNNEFASKDFYCRELYLSVNNFRIYSPLNSLKK